jgi:UDP-N-acetylglucosamine 4,6-dehydratase
MNILITGGTGFFGRAFCRAVEPVSKRVVVYSRDEAKQAEMRDWQKSDRMRWMIGDVRDLQRLTRAMRGIDVVVHAAALKRIEVGQYNPDEMVKTNINGTMNVIEAAISNNVQKVVFLSSDKAYQPISPYGQSKALAESLILQANNITGRDATRFAAVRYGNVAGSTGSVIPRWRRIIQTVAAVPVTDPDATRFWMTQAHAVDMVYGTIMSMTGGELNIPDLPAYRVGDLAEAMGAAPIVTGLPAHEKKHESMDDTRCSESARRMTIKELRIALEDV